MLDRNIEDIKEKLSILENRITELNDESITRSKLLERLILLRNNERNIHELNNEVYQFETKNKSIVEWLQNHNINRFEQWFKNATIYMQDKISGREIIDFYKQLNKRPPANYFVKLKEFKNEYHRLITTSNNDRGVELRFCTVFEDEIHVMMNDVARALGIQPLQAKMFIQEATEDFDRNLQSAFDSAREHFDQFPIGYVPIVECQSKFLSFVADKLLKHFNNALMYNTNLTSCSLPNLERMKRYTNDFSTILMMTVIGLMSQMSLLYRSVFPSNLNLGLIFGENRLRQNSFPEVDACTFAAIQEKFFIRKQRQSLKRISLILYKLLKNNVY